MIGFLRGVLAAKHPPVLWLDVAGVGSARPLPERVVLGVWLG